MQLELDLNATRRVALLLASSADAAWKGAIAPWFSRVRDGGWQSNRPIVVAVPTRAHANALKARLLADKQPALGVQFVTPPYLRTMLWRDDITSLPQREDLRLLLAIAAEETLQDASLTDAERLAATSVRRTPDHLLRLLDQLSAAGVDFERADLPAFRGIVQRFRSHLAQAKLTTFAEGDRAALAHAQRGAGIFGDLLVTGFHAAHWPLWHLLRAAVSASERATVALQNPRVESADLDSAWVGSWEEAFGEATPVDADDTHQAQERHVRFLAGMDTREQAEAIVGAAHSFLAQENCERLAVIFPAANALSRLVAAMLAEQGVAHFDSLGQAAPGVFETGEFWAWMELQRTPRLRPLLGLLTALPSDHALFANIPRTTLRNALQNAFGEIGIDDLDVLVALCRDRNPAGDAVATAFAALRFLPANGSLADFLGATRNAFEQLGWEERWQQIDAHSGITAAVPSSFSRALFLRWLSEIANSFRLTRDIPGQHPYARVQLLTPAQAEAQSWSYLIVAGMNEPAWPGPAHGDFLSASRIDALNHSVGAINRSALLRGRQGEGHVAVLEGRTLFLGSIQERQLALAQFDSLIESTRHGVALAASVVAEATPERLSNASEFFSRIYYEERGEPLSQNTMRALRDATLHWRDGFPSDRGTEPLTPDLEQTRIAYTARRKIKASDEYDFALRTAPKEIKPLSVSDAETMLKTPALVWLKRYLGVEGEDDPTYAWNATAGKWAHSWLAAIGTRGEFNALPKAGEIEKRILAAAKRTRDGMHRLCDASGKRVPDWWQSGWENALCTTLALSRVLATAQDWQWIGPEWRLDSQPVVIGGATLLLRGQADLLLAQTAIKPSSLQLPSLWIIDFKTGAKKSLARSRDKSDEERRKRVLKAVLKREGLQLALYALAAQQLGARDIAVSIISPLVTRAEPQLTLDDFADCTAAFAEIGRMQATGIFGMRGSLRGAFLFAPAYPLATLAIDGETLDERWEETHPALALQEETWW